MGEKMSKLTDKQEAFCREYLVDFNGTQAAIRAGYSQKTAYAVANENLKKPEIIERLSELKAVAAKRNDVTVDEAISMWREIWYVNHRTYTRYDKDGNDVGSVMVDPNAAAKAAEAISKISGAYEKDNQQKQTEFKIEWPTEQ